MTFGVLPWDVEHLRPDELERMMDALEEARMGVGDQHP